MTNRPSSIVTAQEVVGVTVRNAYGENLGVIENIVLSKVSGKVRYVVLSFGGFMGMGNKLLALPWKAISYSPEDGCFILHVEKEKLKNAPFFDKDHWPEMTKVEWEQSITDYYGIFDSSKDAVDSLIKQGVSNLECGKDKVDDAIQCCQKYVQTKPFSGFAVALGVGMLLSKLLSR